MRWMDAKKPILALSPMADFTDLPFCRLIRDIDKETVLFREMVSAEAIVRGNDRTEKMCEITEIEHPVICQLFGSKPDVMAQAAEIIAERFKPDGIDINMGCPVPKATSQFNGASLMRDPGRAVDIVKAVKGAINIPLSVKTRLGWSESQDVIDFAKRIELAGADAIEIHGRTKAQGYSGEADWGMVGKAVAGLEIPAFVNGDIVDPETAKNALSKSGAQGLLIARGALGRPWIVKRIRQSLETGSDPGDPILEERMEFMLKHARYQVEVLGERGLINLRKHLPWYFKGMPGFRQFRADAVKITTLQDVESLVDRVLSAKA